MTTQTPEKTQYAADFERLDREADGLHPSWLRDLRRRGIERFAQVGFPTARRGNEEWKYTNVAPIARGVFAYPFGEEQGSRNKEQGTGNKEQGPATPKGRGIEALSLRPLLLGRDWPTMVFVDGRYRRELSALDGLPRGVRVAGLADAVAADQEMAEGHLGRLVPPEGDGFTALSAAFLHDAAFVHIPAGVEVDQPIHLLFVSTSGASRTGDPVGRPPPVPEAAPASYPRTLIVTGPSSRATVVESHVGITDTAYFADPVTEIVVGAGARLTHYNLALEGGRAYHVATTQVRQERDSSFTSMTVTAGGRLVRNTLNVLLDAEGAETALNGLYLASDDQHVDNHTFIDHARPRTTSRELYKGIVDGRSRAIFSGRILVRRDAQKADARQVNKNLVLSPTAEADTKPFLEIFADDVKCSHGATAGKLDEASLFYLRSRGLDPDRARDLLAYAFANEVLGLMTLTPVKARVERLLLRRLPSLQPKG